MAAKEVKKILKTKKVTRAKKAPKAKESLSIPVVDKKGEDLPRYSLNPAIFQVEGESALLAQTVRSYFGNQRKSEAKTKRRSEVIGSVAKIWRQKGTGRARHGSRKAPIFVGGGVAHGPTGGQNYQKSVPKKMGQKAIKMLLSDKVKEQKMILVKELDFTKTKDAFEFLEKVRTKFGIPKILGLLLCGEENLKKSFGNIDKVNCFNTFSLNSYLLLKTPFLLITDKAIKDLEKKYANKAEINKDES